MASKKPNLLENVQRIATKPAHAPPADRQPTIPYPISTRAPAPELPAQVGTLSERLQEIARQYIGARRRSGEALLEAARWLSEARAEAEHGEWYVFLEATSTTEDTADRLLNIHAQAMQNPQFAEAVRSNWIGQSVAALLARPSTSPDVLADVLNADAPPKVADVEQKVRQSRSKPKQAEGQIPQFAGFGGDDPNGTHSSSAQELLREIALSLVELANMSDDLPADVQTERELKSAEQSLAAIRRAIQRRGGTSTVG
ncbi:MAG: hypothetical protein M3R61_00350 [Chloroflexota bacterium]|nr:hypothetical protein [Chloroflexota bacterium]